MPSSISSRIATLAGDGMPRCVIPGCGRPTMRVTGAGLAAFHCKHHIVHHQRHGSYWHPTYRAADLKPYLSAAQSYIAPRRGTDRFISNAVMRLAALIERSPYDHATRLRGLSAQVRADIAFGRLRRAGVKPERILAIHIAATLLIEEDRDSHRVREFRIVQTAKAIHRLASGHHIVYRDPDGGPLRTELHKYARSSGQVLRLIGEMVEECCELATAEHAAAVMDLKVKRYGKHPSCLVCERSGAG